MRSFGHDPFVSASSIIIFSLGFRMTTSPPFGLHPSISADPCSGEGRGGAWDHRRCRTFAFVKGCSKTSRLLDCGLWALCGTVGGVAQTVGSGLWRAKSLFFLWPETALQTPQTPQTLRHLPMVLPYFWILDASDAPWTLQTLQNLALARLWALGSVRDCGRSCADCGLRALARQILFF